MKGLLKIAVAVMVASGIVGASWVAAQDPKPDEPIARKADVPSLFPFGYLDQAALTAAFEKLAKDHPSAVQVKSLAKTRQGRDVWMVTVGRPPKENDKEGALKPSILIVANLEADHVVGSHVALALVERLAEADGKDPSVTKILDERTIYVVPRLSPDGAEAVLAGKPRRDLRANFTPIDRDRDGKFNEDGPNDLDGDGFSLSMRVKDAKATLMPDAKDARILRKPEALKGEKPVYSEMTEGIDDDNDGAIDEDPPGGVNLNRNWPQGWTEFNPETGVSPASEVEVNALIRFAFAHPEIVAVWSFGLNDNLKGTAPGPDAPYLNELIKAFTTANTVNPTPAKEETPKDEPKAEPVAEKKSDALVTPPPADAPRPKAQGKGAGRGGLRGAGAAAATTPAAVAVPTPGVEGTTDGALSEWASQQFGVVGLASRLWPRPEAPGLTGDGDQRWFEWNDKVMGGSTFVPFHEATHPKLGKVEVGGWKPGVRLNPPVEQIPGIADRHFAFLKDLTIRMPALNIRDVKAEIKGGGLFEIKATVENTGFLPTSLAQGVTTRKGSPVLIKLNLGNGKLISGRALNRVDTLSGSGGSREFRWLILAPEGLKSINLEATCPKAGASRKEIALPTMD